MFAVANNLANVGVTQYVVGDTASLVENLGVEDDRSKDLVVLIIFLVDNSNKESVT